MLQQYLPFTVLKLELPRRHPYLHNVATVLTVYGIETSNALTYASNARALQQYLPFTVLKLYKLTSSSFICRYNFVATVLTVYGIETKLRSSSLTEASFQLQQYLPFTVLKHPMSQASEGKYGTLQQYLPFTVLKR